MMSYWKQVALIFYKKSTLLKKMLCPWRKHLKTSLQDSPLQSVLCSIFSLSSLTFWGSPLHRCHIAKVKWELMGNHICALNHHCRIYWVFVLLFWLGPYLSSVSSFVHISHRVFFFYHCAVSVSTWCHKFFMNPVWCLSCCVSNSKAVLDTFSPSAGTFLGSHLLF